MNQPDGVLLVDKDAGGTSFQVVKAVKKIFNCNKVGHTGTLDPIATGLLPICLGRATKLAAYMMAYDKQYDVWIQFGHSTDSHDCTGRLLEEKPWQHLTPKRIEEKLKAFTGSIVQRPPMFSAVKYQGRPLYWFAHQGIMIEHGKQRQCQVEKFELIDWQPPRARFLVRVSSGTYVRTLVHDLAQALESAAVVESLRRLSVGPLHVDQAMRLSALEELLMPDRLGKILPMSAALPMWPTYQLNAHLIDRLRHGRTLMWSDIKSGEQGLTHEGTEAEAPLFKLIDTAGSLVALAAWDRQQDTNQPQQLPTRLNRIVRPLRLF